MQHLSDAALAHVAAYFRVLGEPTRLHILQCLGACRTWSVESENRRFHQNGPQRGQFLPDSQAHSPAMGQEAGEKWTAAADLQPTISKSDRLLDGQERNVGELAQLCGCSAANISRHMALLAQHALVQREVRGHRTYYRLADASLHVLCDAVYAHLARPGAGAGGTVGAG